jgi:hypothetical protein
MYEEWKRLRHSDQKVRWLALTLLTRLRTIPQPTRRRAGSYGLLETYLCLELGNSSTAFPVDTGRENASVQEGGRRRRSSPRPRCNGEDMVKVRQGKPVKREANGCREEGR